MERDNHREAHTSMIGYVSTCRRPRCTKRGGSPHALNRRAFGSLSYVCVFCTSLADPHGQDGRTESQKQKWSNTAFFLALYCRRALTYVACPLRRRLYCVLIAPTGTPARRRSVSGVFGDLRAWIKAGVDCVPRALHRTPRPFLGHR